MRLLQSPTLYPRKAVGELPATSGYPCLDCVDVILNHVPVIALSHQTLAPSLPVAPGRRPNSTSYDAKTDLLTLGSFPDPDYFTFLNGLLTGYVSLRFHNATQLIIDVVLNSEH
ncbi:hypothetical protein H2248_012380 [Termitomyces sp. 'cryptogamus']|nr:hypothetical protein H2248_012380 [Termitomyces sp. 'cryptogamus']